jgi:hypothetical protein
MHTYSDIYQAAHGQKLDFNGFIDCWLEEHDVWDEQCRVIVTAINKAGWEFFGCELTEYFNSLPEFYKMNEDGTVTVLES